MANETTKQQGKKTRERILHAIISYIEEHGYPPSYREIGRMVGLKSNSTIHTQIKIMLAHGMIESDAEEGCSPRAIRVPGYTFVKKADIERLTPKTNADRIRAMSDEELECFLSRAMFCGGLIAREESSYLCKGCRLPFCQNIKNWLKEEAKKVYE